MNKRKDMDVKSSKVIGIRLTEEEHELLREREHLSTEPLYLNIQDRRSLGQ